MATSILRYKTDEDTGDAIPPKPHRLKPLSDEAGAASPEPAGPLQPRAPDRPPSGEGAASPKTRMLRGAAQPTSLADTLDTTSGASTADTVTPAEGASTSLEDASASAGAPQPKEAQVGKKNRVPLLDEAEKKNPQEVQMCKKVSLLDEGEKKNPQEKSEKYDDTRILDQQAKHITPATENHKASVRKSLNHLSNLALPGASSSAREVVDFYYRKAEQRAIWTEMEQQASQRVMQGHQTHMEDDEHRAAVLEHVPDTNLLGLLDDAETPGSGKPNLEEDLKNEGAKSSKGNSQDAKAGNSDATNTATGAASSSPTMGGDGNAASKPSAAANGTPAKDAKSCPLKGKSPLKELICAKKVDLDQVRAMITRLPDAHMWLETIMDPGPPLVPKPIVYAVGMNDPGLTELLVELGAEVVKPYDGPSMYKGWVKPGSTLIQCVQNRKGRFVGTMLADRLTTIETILHKAVHDQMLKAGEVEKENDEGLTGDAEAQVVEVQYSTPGVNGTRERRKSLAVRTIDGSITRHTHGHPGDVFEISEHLGEQDRSACWVGFHKDTKVPVAIKVESKSDEAWLWEEVNILRKVEHPNVVKLFETFENDTQVFMVLELCEGGRLLDRASAEGNAAYCAKTPRIIKHIAMAVEHLHCKFICHRDLNLENFLLVDDKPLSEVVIKLIDFTTAKRFGAEEPPMKTKICTPGYVAKEILTRKEVAYTEKIDIWSLGVVFFIILSGGSPPFQGSSDFEILKKVKKGTFKFEPEDQWAIVSDAARDLITRMICPKVEDRLTASGVLKHPWLANS